MNKLLSDQKHLKEDATVIVSDSLEEVLSSGRREDLPEIVNNHIRKFYLSLDAEEQESALISALKPIVIQYVDLLASSEEVEVPQVRKRA